MPPTRSAQQLGARTAVPDPPGRHLLVLARDATGYASLSRAISSAHLRGGAKGHPVYDLDELTELAGGRWVVLTGCRKGAVRQALEAGGFGTFALDPARRALAELVDRFGRDNVVVELQYAREPLADERYDALAGLAAQAGLPVVATTNAHYHRASRRRLATVLAGVRARSSLDELDGWLPAWADARLRSGHELAHRFARWPGVVEQSARLADEIAFSLDLLRPELPPFEVPNGPDGFADEMAYLRHLTYAGAVERYGVITAEIRGRLEHELEIIERENFAGYFLVVWDIAMFCRKNGILCQGRGSAAGSAVCFALRVTAIDPIKHQLLFERFLAPDRHEPPDIDIDIESGDPREAVIQFVYGKYGRDRAAQVANSIVYRPKMAIRDVARALGYPAGLQDAWSKQLDQGYWTTLPPEVLVGADGAGADGAGAGGAGAGGAGSGGAGSGGAGSGGAGSGGVDGIPRTVLDLVNELLPLDTPRHLGIHSGGMVICDRPIVEVCPVEWARMPERSVLQWDKDDCEYAHLVKFDLLGLGMLRALRDCFELIERWHGDRYELATIPSERPCVYQMLAKADTIGVFQVESRAQMQALPRLKPLRFYDLAIQVALIRPGPIQGNAVHPYIERVQRHRADPSAPIDYPHPSLEPALRRTLGVPLFQEQLMEIAIHGANFSAAEADQLRRAMGSKRGTERIDALQDRLYEGLAGNGITGATADDIVNRIKAFASFGFAESHALSFALLVYASAWLKRHYPAAFLAALLNAQPMGFYSPQSLVHDAKRHGLTVLRPDINLSAAGASLTAGPNPVAKSTHPAEEGSVGCACGDSPVQPAVRLGLAEVRGIDSTLAERIVAARAVDPFSSLTDLVRRTGLATHHVEALATAGAFDGFGMTRRDAIWSAGAVAAVRPGQLEVDTERESSIPPLPAMTEPEQLIADMWATGVTLDAYPTALIRDRLDRLGVVPAARLRDIPDRTRITVGGIVTHRQRPSTGHGVIFISLEDETGVANVICRQDVWARHRRVARESGGLLIRGMLERAGEVSSILAERIERLPLGVSTKSRDFR